MLRDWSFAGDIELIQEIYYLINRYNIKNIVETGTWKGTTTKLLSAMAEKVFTVEINEDYFKETKDLDNYENIIREFGNSPEILEKWFKEDSIKQPSLFFLDAHWNDYNPLLDELKMLDIYNMNKSIIVIHDFYNPFHKEFGYDQYGDITYNMDYIRVSLNKIYNIDNWKYYYNSKSTGDKRGVIFIMPKNFK